MKKTIACFILPIIIAFAICFGMTGCGYNRTVLDVNNYVFNEAYINLGDKVIKVDVDQWRDWEDSDMLQVTTADGTVYYTHSTNIILIKKP